MGEPHPLLGIGDRHGVDEAEDDLPDALVVVVKRSAELAVHRHVELVAVGVEGEEGIESSLAYPWLVGALKQEGTKLMCRTSYCGSL